MELFIIVAAAALATSAVTLFSGFGLGTVLTPVFALFLPIQTAIAATALVHLANNLFKLGLMGRRADWPTVARFGLPAAGAAFLGAAAMVHLAALPPIASYALWEQTRSVTPIKLLIGILIVGFASLELSPRFATLAIPKRHLPWGGLLSGFFGGLSGNQGAFRSAFLIKAGLDKESFVATGVVCAVIVDVTRLTVYGAAHFLALFEALPRGAAGLVATATLAAFAGAYFGARMLGKLTFRAVRIIVAAMMIAVGIGLALGVI